jgi:hypoxanthine phosphoribosyltransferase
MMNKNVEELISSERINKRLDEMRDEIKKDFEGQTIVFVCVLKGAVALTVELALRLPLDVKLDFLEVSSYGDETKTSGVVKITKDISNPITGENVILVEDIIDSGRTLNHIIKHLKAQRPKSLKICALLDKPSRREMEVSADYVGFTIPNEFVVGFGLDYAQRYRNLPYVGILTV